MQTRKSATGCEANVKKASCCNANTEEATGFNTNTGGASCCDANTDTATGNRMSCLQAVRKGCRLWMEGVQVVIQTQKCL